MDANLKEIAEFKLDQLKKALDLLQQRRIALTAQEQALHAQSHAWRLILASEPETQATERLEAAADKITLDVIRANDKEIPTHQRPTLGEQVDIANYGAKTRLIREYLAMMGSEGATPKGITDYLRSRSVRISSTFASSALFKMKDKGEVEAVNGRYYVTSLAPRSMFQPNEKEASEETSNP